MKKALMDVGHKAVTLGLFSVTMWGGYVFMSGANHIVTRRMNLPKESAVPPDPTAETSTVSTSK